MEFASCPPPGGIGEKMHLHDKAARKDARLTAVWQGLLEKSLHSATCNVLGLFFRVFLICIP